jgi:serine/threonine protein kinase
MQVIHHIAERLEDLHNAGYCHRDLKPGNVMWLPRRNRWTLIDFGCAAEVGKDAPMGYSLACVPCPHHHPYLQKLHGCSRTGIQSPAVCMACGRAHATCTISTFCNRTSYFALLSFDAVLRKAIATQVCGA